MVVFQCTMNRGGGFIGPIITFCIRWTMQWRFHGQYILMIILNNNRVSVP